MNTPYIVYLGMYLLLAVLGAFGMAARYKLAWVDALILSNGFLAFLSLATCGAAYSGRFDVPFGFAPGALISVGIALWNQSTSRVKALQAQKLLPAEGTHQTRQA